MSKFLDILRARIDGCGIGDLEQYAPIGLFDEVNVNIDKILERIDSLGENARRMLEIGIVQDELVKLGFYPLGDTYIIESMGCEIREGIYRVDFDLNYVTVVGLYKYDYNSPTFREDVINKVKELINEN